MLGAIAKAFFGSENDRVLKKMQARVDAINALEPSLQGLDDEALKERTNWFKNRMADGETLDDLLVEAFATVREAAKRTLNQRHFDVQLLGGIVLHEGKIAEMKTGEGKTLVATLPVYLNALKGNGVHVVTVNDYLARRDSSWMGEIYEFLGLTVGVIVQDLSDEERQSAYAADVTYGTSSIPELRPDQVANLGIARTFQNIELFENMTVIDNILFGAHSKLNYGAISSLFYTRKVRNSEREAREIAEDIIDFLEIEQYRYSYILSLPYGVQKRVELGRALAMNPEIVLLDEPAAGMNSEETEDIARFIIDLHEERKKTVILVDHDMNMVMDIAERVMVLNFGEKLAEGTPKEIVVDENVIEAYLGGK